MDEKRSRTADHEGHVGPGKKVPERRGDQPYDEERKPGVGAGQEVDEDANDHEDQ